MAVQGVVAARFGGYCFYNIGNSGAKICWPSKIDGRKSEIGKLSSVKRQFNLGFQLKGGQFTQILRRFHKYKQSKQSSFEFSSSLAC